MREGKREGTREGKEGVRNWRVGKVRNIKRGMRGRERDGECERERERERKREKEREREREMMDTERGKKLVFDLLRYTSR